MPAKCCSTASGHGPRERALLAQIVRYPRTGTPGLDELAPLARRGDAGRLRGDDRLGRWVLARQSDDDAIRSAFGRPLLAAP